MSIYNLLVHRVNVWRRPGTLDRFSQPNEADTSQSPTVTYRCRWDRSTGSKIVDGRTEQIFVELYELFLMPGADIREDDEIEVLDRLGNVIHPRSRVQNRSEIYGGSGSTKPHHTQLYVWVERGPQSAPGL